MARRRNGLVSWVAISRRPFTKRFLEVLLPHCGSRRRRLLSGNLALIDLNWERCPRSAHCVKSLWTSQLPLLPLHMISALKCLGGNEGTRTSNGLCHGLS